RREIERRAVEVDLVELDRSVLRALCFVLGVYRKLSRHPRSPRLGQEKTRIVRSSGPTEQACRRRTAQCTSVRRWDASTQMPRTSPDDRPRTAVWRPRRPDLFGSAIAT